MFSPADKPSVMAVQQGDDGRQAPRSHHFSCSLIAARQAAQRPHGSLLAGQHLQTAHRHKRSQTALELGTSIFSIPVAFRGHFNTHSVWSHHKRLSISLRKNKAQQWSLQDNPLLDIQ